MGRYNVRPRFAPHRNCLGVSVYYSPYVAVAHDGRGGTIVIHDLDRGWAFLTTRRWRRRTTQTT
ncbi:MAG: hypothetical protein MJE68_11705 [Proteobacteria bacterium]|nr:hypothetical protein [Pseudomonadota bacterium]